MDGLHVDGELTALIRDDHDANGATARLESLGETSPKVGLIDDGQALLDITSLGHGNNYKMLGNGQWYGGRESLPEPSWRSRTRYCLKTGPSMVWTTTLGLGLEMNEDSSCNCLVKRSTPKYLCWPVAADVVIRMTWQGRPWRIKRSPRRMWWHGIVTVLGV